MKIEDRKKELGVLGFFLLLAFFSLCLSNLLPNKIGGDEVVTLLTSHSSKIDNFPDASLIASMDLQNYWHHKIIYFLSNNFSTEFYHKLLLFFYVFLAGYGAYWALRIIGISRVSSILVSAAALMPRMSPGQTFFGVFTDYEVAGRSLALSFIWLISAINIQAWQKNNSIWPVFLLSGLFVYVHPVSMVFFTSLLFIVNLVWLLKYKNFKYTAKQILYSILVFGVSASLLIKEILARLVSPISQISESAYNATEYAQALVYRMPWDFMGQTILWLRQVAVVSSFFIVFILLVWYLAKKKSYQFSFNQKQIFFWSVIFLCLGPLFSLVLPNAQLYLVENFDWPFLLQQSSRFFKFYYLALFIIFAVFLDIFRHYFKSKAAFTIVFIVAMMSSSLGFEWAQYIMGYSNYQKEYLPRAWQVNPPEGIVGKEARYQQICHDLSKLGVSDKDLIISYDFDLRYFCSLKIYTSFEEGTFYMMRGKNDLVHWQEMFKEQDRALQSDGLENLLDLASRVGASYAVLENNLPVASAIKESDLEYYIRNTITIVKFKN